MTWPNKPAPGQRWPGVSAESARPWPGMLVRKGSAFPCMRLFATICFAAFMHGGVGCHTTPRTTSAELRAKHPDWPLTVDDAVTKILAEMSEADKAAVRSKTKDELIEYHLSWGLGIRNYYGLWNGNYSLLADCHTDVPDGASMVIIEAVWQKLQTQ